MKPFRGIVLICGILVFSVGVNFAEVQRSDYHGEIAEDASPNTDVTLDIDIIVKNRDGLVGEGICGYTLYKSHDPLPFKIVLENETTGLAKLQLETGQHLNFAEQHAYNFQIAAHDCVTGNHAQRESVHIEVLPVAPPAESTWEQESYKLEVEEDKVYDDILQLEIEGLEGDALRRCQFHISTPDVPFVIDNEERMGILRNTEKLSYDKQHNYMLEVVAHNCGENEKNSKPLLIDVNVKHVCTSQWQDVQDILSYEADKRIKPIAESARLRLCDDTCDAETVRVSVTLNTRGVGKGCDRDTYSVKSQRKLCGASEDIVDLLPNPSLGMWTRDAEVDDGKEGDEIFAFDGTTTSIEIPEDKFAHTLEQQFTIMTWMKHEPEADELTSHKKEHILCNTDGEEKNRHHYSLFIHNCKLVLLLRQEFHEGIDLKVFKPAEWRWEIPHVCDGEWHHYAINMNFPNALLHIDGAPFSDVPHHNPDVIDDWALHPVAGVHSTKLVVGACWMAGQEQHLTQYFKGYLAGLSILNGITESDQVLKCMTHCAEKLDFHAMSDMETGMTVTFNSEMSEITIEGNKIESVEKLFRKVGYENSRVFPTQGHRTIEINTEINCTDHRQLSLPTISTSVVVPATATPIIKITGTGKLSRRAESFAPGVAIFPDISIYTGTKAELDELLEDSEMLKSMNKLEDKDDIFENLVQDTDYDKNYNIPLMNQDYKLDSCIVKIDPVMNFDDYNKEHIKYPENLIDQLMLEVYQKEDGLIISGAEKVENYVLILQQLKYYNSRADQLNYITFTLTCSELNGRFVSNQFQVQLHIEHEAHPQKPFLPPVAHVKDNTLSAQEKVFPQSQNELKKSSFVSNIGHGAQASAGAGVGMVVIVVVCVGFLLLMITLGVVRIRSTHRRNRDVAMDEKAEMEWDNSALTITVNPMDQGAACEDEGLAGVHGEDTDSDDDMSSFHGDHDDCDSSEEEPDIRELKSRGLEWDESDLSKYQCKV